MATEKEIAVSVNVIIPAEKRRADCIEAIKEFAEKEGASGDLRVIEQARDNLVQFTFLVNGRPAYIGYSLDPINEALGVDVPYPPIGGVYQP